MKLILQAIKSLFRNVHNAIGGLKSDVADLKDDVVVVQKVAKNANNKAIALDAAVTESKRVLHARISSGDAIVQENVTLEDGLVYTLIPNADSSFSGDARVSVNGQYIDILCGVTRNDTYPGNNRPKAMNFFRKEVPVLLLYCASERCFHAITKEDLTYVSVNYIPRDPSGIEYFLAWYREGYASKIQYMRVPSSTIGSKKLFDIKVDDSGTITAVEVIK